MSNDATNGYAEVNGLKMYYERHGDGPPLVQLSMAPSAPSRAASPGCCRSSRATDGKTLMTMVQRGFPSAELRDEHRAGLPNAVARLEQAIEE
jgi:hypothetical protein